MASTRLQPQRVTGELIGHGDYVYEPEGNADWWRLVGNETMTALVVVCGQVDFLAADGTRTLYELTHAAGRVAAPLRRTWPSDDHYKAMLRDHAVWSAAWHIGPTR